MKGHLDAKQLESMKREELQALAKELGVNAGGKNEEIISRIAAVEVDVPEKEGLTEEEKEASNQAAREAAEKEAAEQETKEATEREEDEQAAREAAEREAAERAAKEAAEKKAAEREAKQAAKKAAGIVTVKIVTRFLDKQLNRIKDAGEVYEVDKERASELVAAGVAIIQE